MPAPEGAYKDPKGVGGAEHGSDERLMKKLKDPWKRESLTGGGKWIVERYVWGCGGGGEGGRARVRQKNRDVDTPDHKTGCRWEARLN